MIDELPYLRDLIAPAIDRLHSLDIEPDLYVSPFLHSDQLDAFNSEFGLTLPRETRQLYSETDGFMISWESGGDWGQFEFPSLYDLRLYRQRWVNGDMPDKELTKHLADDDAHDVLERMKSWLPFDESGSGNLMCIDCLTGYIVEYDHEWGNLTKRNGTIFATDLRQYIESCCHFCFYCVWLGYFEQVVRDNECWIDWTSGKIPAKYVIRGPRAT